MTFIKEYIEASIDKGVPSKIIARELNVSVSMVSAYRLHQYNPSLAVAKTVYQIDFTVLHPFSEESLKYEIEKDSK